ncbi:MAG: hypothetical protein RIE16_16300, partial [Rhodospirillales bacterium]
MNLFQHFQAEVTRQIDALAADGALPAGLDTARLTVEPPRDTSHGDITTNAAMVLDLFLQRHRQPPGQVQARLHADDRHLRRRPRRLCKAHE